jgi:hypothetical protein
MLQNRQNNDPIDTPAQSPNTEGWWRFDKEGNGVFSDSSGKGNSLTALGDPGWSSEDDFPGAFSFDGKTQCLGTASPILSTDESFSVAAWVRLDSSTLSGVPILKKDEHARTAVSQDSSTHSAFYLGVRRIQETRSDGVTVSSIKWSFTISPIDGRETGLLDWRRANSSTPLDASVLDKWFMLVGVCDVNNRSAHIYIPNINESGIVYVQDDWEFWKANGSLQIGRSRWLGKDLDYWPGSIGPVKVFSGVLTAEDAKQLYLEKKL